MSLFLLITKPEWLRYWCRLSKSMPTIHAGILLVLSMALSPARQRRFSAGSWLNVALHTAAG
eukprot:6093988-Karenia_brevis.AAC.1